MIQTSLTLLRPGWYPPNITALWSLMEVNEKKEQGGGRGPVVGGDDHSPAESEVVQYLQSVPDSSIRYSSCEYFTWMIDNSKYVWNSNSLIISVTHEHTVQYSKNYIPNTQIWPKLSKIQTHMNHLCFTFSYHFPVASPPTCVSVGHTGEECDGTPCVEMSQHIHSPHILQQYWQLIPS